MEQPISLFIAAPPYEASPQLAHFKQDPDYIIHLAKNGLELVKQTITQHCDLILISEHLDGLDGFETCRVLRKTTHTRSTPIILLLKQHSHEGILRGLEAGADDCLGGDWDTALLRLRIRTLVRVYRHQRRKQEESSIFQLFNKYPDGILIMGMDARVKFANRKFRDQILSENIEEVIGKSIYQVIHHQGLLRYLNQWLESPPQKVGEMVLAEDIFHIHRHAVDRSFSVEMFAGYVDWGGELALQLVARPVQEGESPTRQATSPRNVYDLIVEGWAQAIRDKDRETEGHCRRVTEWSETLARSLGVSEQEIVQIRRGAMLHDIGKLGIPEHILNKPGPLDDQEWEIMRQHPDYARQMIAPILYLEPAMEIPYAHHEHWDGSGYPAGLAGETIPLSARLFSVIDVWDALNSDRPYRKAWPREKALRYIREMSGVLFDPQVVAAFLAIVNPHPETNSAALVH